MKKKPEIINVIDNLNDIGSMVEGFQKIQSVARKIGIDNITQPGLIKELIMACKLEHNVIGSKHNADAIDKNSNLYEYLSCQITAKQFAIDGLHSRPAKKMEEDLERISRNNAIYCGVFDGVLLQKIIKVETSVLLEHTRQNLLSRDKNGSSSNTEHTVNYSLGWVESVGTKVYEEKGTLS